MSAAHTYTSECSTSIREGQEREGRGGRTQGLARYLIPIPTPHHPPAESRPGSGDNNNNNLKTETQRNNSILVKINVTVHDARLHR
jgi:hypothetical protein